MRVYILSEILISKNTNFHAYIIFTEIYIFMFSSIIIQYLIVVFSDDNIITMRIIVWH